MDQDFVLSELQQAEDALDDANMTIAADEGEAATVHIEEAIEHLHNLRTYFVGPAKQKKAKGKKSK